MHLPILIYCMHPALSPAVKVHTLDPTLLPVQRDPITHKLRILNPIRKWLVRKVHVVLFHHILSPPASSPRLLFHSKRERKQCFSSNLSILQLLSLLRSLKFFILSSPFLFQFLTFLYYFSILITLFYTFLTLHNTYVYIHSSSCTHIPRSIPISRNYLLISNIKRRVCRFTHSEIDNRLSLLVSCLTNVGFFLHIILRLDCRDWKNGRKKGLVKRSEATRKSIVEKVDTYLPTKVK